MFILHRKGGIKEVAKSLGTSTKTIYRKLQALGIRTDRPINEEQGVGEYDLVELEKKVIADALKKYCDKSIVDIAVNVLGVSEKKIYYHGLNESRENTVWFHRRNKKQQATYPI